MIMMIINLFMRRWPWSDTFSYDDDEYPPKRNSWWSQISWCWQYWLLISSPDLTVDDDESPPNRSSWYFPDGAPRYQDGWLHLQTWPWGKSDKSKTCARLDPSTTDVLSPGSRRYLQMKVERCHKKYFLQESKNGFNNQTSSIELLLYNGSTQLQL